MTQKIVIDPVTRIEGHSKITITMDDRGKVDTAHFHITQYRGFEKFIHGRPFTEMPGLMGRICGICTISHSLASAKACDAVMAVGIPKTADKLRRLVNYASVLQSHALSFYHLSSPDFLLGMDSDPARRNIFGVIESHPQMAKDGVLLRRFGQQIVEWLSGKRVHTNWIVAGGVAQPMEEETRDSIIDGLPRAFEAIRRGLDYFKGVYRDYSAEIGVFGNYPSKYMGLVTPDGGLELYDGMVRVADENLIKVTEFAPAMYQKFIGEAVEPWSFLKFPYWLADGYPKGIYRVGPLGRLNVIDRIGTLMADNEFREFRQVADRSSCFSYHYARLIEILFALERIRELANDPSITDDHVRAFAGPNASEGVGITEAPRGTLIHHYEVDRNGMITDANLVVSTTHNNLAMNKAVAQVAKHYIRADKISEGALNRVEAVVRTFDPCLSCSTHADGSLALHVELRAADGTLLDEVYRD